MDKLSELIKEAKPLYKKRQRRARIIKTTLGLFIPFFFFLNIYTLYLEGDKVYMAMSNEAYQNQIFNEEYYLFE